MVADVRFERRLGTLHTRRACGLELKTGIADTQGVVGVDDLSTFTLLAAVHGLHRCTADTQFRRGTQHTFSCKLNLVPRVALAVL